MNIDHLTLLFADGHTTRINGEYIGQIVVDNIKQSIRRTFDGNVSEGFTANTVVLEISSKANLDGKEESTFDHIVNKRDITAIEFTLMDSTSSKGYFFFTDWQPSDNGNINQDCYISKLGHLYIVIDHEASVFNYFVKDIIDGEAE